MTSSKGEKKSGDEFVLMQQVYDNLQFLNYEVEFDPISRKLPFLTPYYFAIQGKSSLEQFTYFSSLCIWMMKQYFDNPIEIPSDYDVPTTVADNLIINLPSVGFKINFAPTKLVPGYGLPICTILEGLTRKTISKLQISPSPFRIIAGVGGNDDEIETRGDDDEDNEAVLDEAIDIQDEMDTQQDNVMMDFSRDSRSKVIDPLELKAEAERVAPRLQVKIPAEKGDWRTHFAQMNQHQKNISDIMTQVSPILSKVGADVTKAIELIETRERTLNNRFETSVIEYSTRAKSLETVEKKHKERVATVSSLQTELNSVVEKLSKTKELLDEKQKEVSDHAPLMGIKTATTKLRDEIKALELRSAILQRSLTQAWLDEKAISDD